MTIMPEEKKDNLEEFFRKRVERLHFNYREDDWRKLEIKLDGTGALKSGSLQNKLIWAGVGAIIATLILLLIGLEQGFVNFSDRINTNAEKVISGNQKNDVSSSDDDENVKAEKSQSLESLNSAESTIKNEESTGTGQNTNEVLSKDLIDNDGKEVSNPSTGSVSVLKKDNKTNEIPTKNPGKNMVVMERESQAAIVAQEKGES